MGAGRLCQLCLQIDSCGRDLGKVQRSAGVEGWERLEICCVSTSKRRNPVDLRSEEGFMGAFFLLEISPWPMALTVSLSERHGFFAIGETQRGGGGKSWAGGISFEGESNQERSAVFGEPTPTVFGDQRAGSGAVQLAVGASGTCAMALQDFPGQQ